MLSGSRSVRRITMTRGSGKPTKLCCIVSLTNDVAHWPVLPHPRRLVPQPTSPTNGLSGTAPWTHLDCRADQARPSHVFLVCRPSKLVPLTIVQVRLIAYDLAGRIWFFSHPVPDRHLCCTLYISSYIYPLYVSTID